MKKLVFISIIISVLFLCNCQSSKQIRAFGGLSSLKNDYLQIVMIDTTIYNVNNFTYNDTTITIVGKKNKNGLKTNFKGKLEFSKIAYIQTQEGNFFQSLGFVAATSAIVLSGASNLGSTSEIHPTLKIIYPKRPGGGGSCPFIYSWDGEQFQIEGEAFGTALGKALETETCIVLPQLQSSDNKFQIKLTNERPETHFFNNINIAAIEVDKDVTVYCDNKNKLQSVVVHKKINGASDFNNKDLSAQLLNEDDLYWESDLSTANSNQNFEDQIFVELRNIGEVDSISLVVSAINTDISSTVFKYLHTLLGNELANFTRAAETDEELINILKETLIRSALKIDLWDGEKWQYTDLIFPEANYVKFKKLVRLPVVNHGDKLRIRLRCLTDVWKLDAIHFDDSIPRKVKTYQAEILNFNSNTLGNIDDIKEKDDLYIKLLPGQEIELEFRKVETTQNKNIFYATNVGGYLYEWVIDESLSVGEGIENLDTSTPKIKLVKGLMKNMNTFLPIIYENWKLSKRNFALKN